ncbi:unnamed protein product [Heligmosomoides polygyrus]|uniref:Uncharacterized protein n=1 Tax=Heligmosomoides polygyrus TaxID=6339 RepID=A0A183GJS7_HELPZ|nr:unnamed protein product [Heligmosomoides polygyrus]
MDRRRRRRSKAKPIADSGGDGRGRPRTWGRRVDSVVHSTAPGDCTYEDYLSEGRGTRPLRPWLVPEPSEARGSAGWCVDPVGQGVDYGGGIR